MTPAASKETGSSAARAAGARVIASARMARTPRLLLATVCLAGGVAPYANPQEEAVGGLVRLFDDHQVVLLGERHSELLDSELRLALVRHPGFAEAVDDIVIEFGNPLHQDIADQYIAGGDVTIEAVRPFWRETLFPGTWDSPVYEEFFVAVREINRMLPAEQRIRVLTGEPPVDWSRIRTSAEYALLAGRRDAHAASVVEREIFAKGRKALVIYGRLHVAPTGERGREKLGDLIVASHPNVVFRVGIMAGESAEYRELREYYDRAGGPLFFSFQGTPFGNLPATTFRGGPRIVISEGSKYVIASGTLADAADGCVYFGPGPRIRVPADPAIYEDTPYGVEVARRQRLASQ